MQIANRYTSTAAKVVKILRQGTQPIGFGVIYIVVQLLLDIQGAYVARSGDWRPYG